MKAIICDNSWKEKWDNFVIGNASDGGLLQSWAWGEFQAQIGRKVYRIALVDDSENIKSAVQLVRHDLPLGKNYLYAPRGPITDDITSQDFKLLLREIKRMAAKRNSVFFRMDPPLEDNQETKNILKNLGFNFVGEAQPKNTLILNLANDDTEIMAKMKSKTRYNIKVAQKHCVKMDEGSQYFEDFWKLMQKTAKRDKIKVHSKKYYQKMLETLGGAGIMKLIVAKFDDKVIAGNLITVFGKWCVYLHGASDHDYRDKMAPYLLQWEGMLFAKSRWCQFYDFWGANEKKWPGVTRFKTGFAPEKEFTSYIGAYDMSVNHLWYLAYRMIQKIRNKNYE